MSRVMGGGIILFSEGTGVVRGLFSVILQCEFNKLEFSLREREIPV